MISIPRWKIFIVHSKPTRRKKQMKKSIRNKLKTSKTNKNNSDTHIHRRSWAPEPDGEPCYMDGASLMCPWPVQQLHTELLVSPTLAPLSTSSLKTTIFSVSYSLSQIRQFPHWILKGNDSVTVYGSHNTCACGKNSQGHVVVYTCNVRISETQAEKLWFISIKMH